MTKDAFNAGAGDAALVAAAESHDFEGIAGLLRNGANADAGIPGHGPLLVYAVRQGNEGLVDSIAAAGADINAPDAQGDTALIWAARHGLFDILEKLLSKGADPLHLNAAGEDGIAAAKASARAFGNDPNILDEDLENAFARLGRATSILERAQEQARKTRTIDSCHAGLENSLVIGAPLKFRIPAPTPAK